MRNVFLTLILGLLAARSFGAVVISEMLYGWNVQREYIELQSSTENQSLNGYALLAIYASDIEGLSGRLDKVFFLDNYTVGGNGLLLLRNTNTILPDPAPGSETTVVPVDFVSTPAGDTSNVNSNHLPGSPTLWLLVSGFTPASLAALPNSEAGHKTLDLDTDGELDSNPWTTIHHGFFYTEDGEGLTTYTEGLSYNLEGDLDGTTDDVPIPIFTEIYDQYPNAVIRTPDYPTHDGMINVKVNQIGDGRYEVDLENYPTEAGYYPENSYYLTPGGLNPPLVPEPASVALLAAGLIGLAGRRRR